MGNKAADLKNQLYPKKLSIISIIMGVLSSSFAIDIWLLEKCCFLNNVEKMRGRLIFSTILGVVGLILGIKSLKLGEKKWGNVGIILCIIGLLPFLFFLFIMLVFLFEPPRT